MKNLVLIIKKGILRKSKTRISDFEIPEPTSEGIEPTDEELNKIAENNYKAMKLYMWMAANFDNIFEVAPKNADYAVGVLEKIKGKEMPTIHYFNSKYTKKSIFNIFRATNPKGTLDFIKEQIERGNVVFNCIYRHQGEVEFMFYAA